MCVTVRVRLTDATELRPNVSETGLDEHFLVHQTTGVKMTDDELTGPFTISIPFLLLPSPLLLCGVTFTMSSLSPPN